MSVQIPQSSDEYAPLISIVIPTRNEEADIAETLGHCLAIEYEPKEIIVVDDSTDSTPQIVAGYSDPRVRIIHREKNRNGCCGARNLGMQSAHGEIVVLLNADDRPRPDFLRRILAHYRNGADYVVVRSEILNCDTVWGRYLFSSTMLRSPDRSKHTWSEGFSCRREAACSVGYIPGDYPIPFCRDNLFGIQLELGGFKKQFDSTIPMGHLAPGTLKDFWHNQVWRGTITAPYAHYVRGMSVAVVALREIAKAMRTVLLDLLLIPPLWRSYQCSRYGSSFLLDIPGLFIVGLVQDMATMVGNLQGLSSLIHAEGIT